MQDQVQQKKLKIIDPKTVLVMTPAIDGRVECGYAGGLMAAGSSGLVGGVHFLISNSSISGARGECASIFLASQFEWLVFIDSDIQFSREDFLKLLEVCDDPVVNGRKISLTRNERGEEIAVTAEYSKKNPQMEPVRFGLGFVRLHRSLFEKLDSMREKVITEDGSDAEGGELLGRFYNNGKICVDYFPELCTTDNRKMHEDGSFWTYVRAADITPRIETRTRLVHWGRQGFAYGASLGG